MTATSPPDPEDRAERKGAEPAPSTPAHVWVAAAIAAVIFGGTVAVSRPTVSVDEIEILLAVSLLAVSAMIYTSRGAGARQRTRLMIVACALSFAALAIAALLAENPDDAWPVLLFGFVLMISGAAALAAVIPDAILIAWLPVAAVICASTVAVALAFYVNPVPDPLTLVAAAPADTPGSTAAQPVDLHLDVAVKNCAENPEVHLRFTDRTGRALPLSAGRIVVLTDADGDGKPDADDPGEAKRTLGAALHPLPRTVLSCYLRLPRLLGSAGALRPARTQALARRDGKAPPLTALTVRRAIVRVDPGTATLAVVRGVSPDQGGTPSGWVCTGRKPLDFDDEPIGCQAALSLDMPPRSVLQNLLNVLIGIGVGAVITLFGPALRKTAEAKKAGGSGHTKR